ncbi:hypothetical protein Tco_1239041, partial [Tanacetum coccineum]
HNKETKEAIALRALTTMVHPAANVGLVLYGISMTFHFLNTLSASKASADANS